jgi:SAM-dependent methyltransferase
MRLAGMTNPIAMEKTDQAQTAEELSRLDIDDLDYVERNRTAWERWAPEYVAAGQEAWKDELRWGIWGIPESEIHLLQGLEGGADVIELGCGTAAISSWLKRRGYRPVGVDIVRAQLETAARFQRESGISFGLLCANAENLHYEDACFDLAISEYGASLWCDPYRWLSEAHRLLRARGHLIFITNSALLMACTPADGGPAKDRLVRDYFSTYRTRFPGDDAIEFHLTHGQWVHMLRATGFILENLIEVQAPSSAKARFGFASLEWARRWPSEDIWVVSKRD